MSRGRPERFKSPAIVDPPVVAGRVPPHDLDAEAAVLSAVLLDRDALDRVLEILKPEHFYSEANARIYQAAQQLAIALTPIDIVSVASWLRTREWLQKMGGTAYLAQLADATPAVGHVAAHAKVVHEKWRLRQLIATCQRVAAEGYGDVGEVQDFIDGTHEAIFDLAECANLQEQSAPMSRIATTVYARLVERMESGKRIAGHPTGYEDLDSAISGLEGTQLVIVAARPGMGKTALAMNIAENIAAVEPHVVDDVQWQDGVIVFSLEMSKEQLCERMACCVAELDLGRFRSGYLNAEDLRKFTDALTFVQGLPIEIDDSSGITAARLRVRAQRLIAKQRREHIRTRAIFVDYLQLMGSHLSRKDVSREEQVAENSKALKGLAKDLKLPVVVLAQLNRGVEHRSDKRPQLADLRESGAIEQDADVVIMLYRDDYYNPESPDRGICELLIRKQRNGGEGVVPLRFAAHCTRFTNLERQRDLYANG